MCAFDRRWCVGAGLMAMPPPLLLHSIEKDVRGQQTRVFFVLLIGQYFLVPAYLASNPSSSECQQYAASNLLLFPILLLSVLFAREMPLERCALHKFLLCYSINFFSVCSVRFLCVIAASFKVVVGSDDVLLRSGNPINRKMADPQTLSALECR